MKSAIKISVKTRTIMLIRLKIINYKEFKIEKNSRQKKSKLKVSYEKHKLNNL